MKRFRSVISKYVLGYVAVGVFAVFFLITSVFMNGYVSERYEAEIAELGSISELEAAANDLYEEIDLIYLYLSDTEIGNYDEKKQAVTGLLAETQRQVEAKFVREMADTNSTIETYIEKCDELIAQLEIYFDSDKTSDYDVLESMYNEQQEVYSYVVDGFQGVYSVRLNSLSEMEKQMNRFQMKITLLEAICLIIAIGGCFAYLVRTVREIASSIAIMMSGVSAIKEDVFQAEPLTIHSNDEFEEFANAFNEMIRVIQDQMKRIEEDANVKERLGAMEIENLKMFSDLQKSHLDFLQSRINPHFLFNTLNMIASMARIENADQSAEMMETTASFLRYNLDNISKTVTLAQEIENLKDYVAIQEYRYGGRYRYDFQVDENCMDFQMPCMILQPLVENAIQHGLAMKLSGGYVQVKCYLMSNRVFLEVTDNGVGMTKEQIAETYKDFYENNSSTTHIGLRNIYKRLELFYKEDVQFELNNMEPGLEITITLPWEGRSL
ncbi:MAG: histidine kinase [Clostridiales bacterium]|nr:histidine kinase [Clostridiales bacterium]